MCTSTVWRMSVWMGECRDMQRHYCRCTPRAQARVRCARALSVFLSVCLSVHLSVCMSVVPTLTAAFSVSLTLCVCVWAGGWWGPGSLRQCCLSGQVALVNVCGNENCDSEQSPNCVLVVASHGDWSIAVRVELPRSRPAGHRERGTESGAHTGGTA